MLCLKIAYALFCSLLTACGIYVSFEIADIINKLEKHGDIIDGYYCQIIDLILIVVIFTFIFSILNLAGIINNNVCNLITSGVLDIILLIIMVSLGIQVVQLTTSQRNSLYNAISTNFHKVDSSEFINEKFHNLQKYFGCCGVLGPKDYGETAPPSCCRNFTGESCPVKDTKAVYTEGCVDVIAQFLMKSMNYLCYISLICWGVLATSAAFAILYAKFIFKQD